MKKLTLGARIKSLLPTLSISLPAIITGILIFSERNLMDPLTSLFAKSEEKKDEKELVEEKGSKGEEKEKEKGEKDAKGNKKGKDKKSGKVTKGDKEDGDGGESASSKGLDDQNKDGDSGEDGLKDSKGKGQDQNGNGEQGGENTQEAETGSLDLSLGQESEVHGTDDGDPQGSGKDLGIGDENKDIQETEQSNLISSGQHNGQVEERKTRRSGGGSRQ